MRLLYLVLVLVIDLGVVDGMYFMVMDFLEGLMLVDLYEYFCCW